MADPSPRARWHPFAAVPPKVRRLILFGAPTNVAGGFFFVVVSAYLPEVGLGPEVVGTILGVSGLMMVLSAIPLGIVSDRRGRRTMLINARQVMREGIGTQMILLAIEDITEGDKKR